MALRRIDNSRQAYPREKDSIFSSGLMYPKPTALPEEDSPVVLTAPLSPIIWINVLFVPDWMYDPTGMSVSAKMIAKT
jgi:hypothetical protein